MDLGSSTELITLKPWSTGKQLPLGFSVFDQATSDLAPPEIAERQATSLTQLESIRNYES